MFNKACNTFLTEGLEYKDLEGLMKPEIHVDEFASKMGEDDDVIVISFFVRDEQAAKDLMVWFERGYEFIIDADRSPGEIKPNRYLVYIEIRRRSVAGLQVEKLLGDLETLTEFEPSDWSIVYQDKTEPFTVKNFEQMIPLSPAKYREQHEGDLNEMRLAAGLPTKVIYERDEDMLALQTAAGIK